MRRTALSLALLTWIAVSAAASACSDDTPAGSPPGDGGPTDTGTPDRSVTPLDGSAPADAATGDADAAGADGDADADAGGLTVHGRVVDELAIPFAGCTVAIGGKTATTAADGSFTLTGVTAPYDVIGATPDKQ